MGLPGVMKFLHLIFTAIYNWFLGPLKMNGTRRPYTFHKFSEDPFFLDANKINKTKQLPPEKDGWKIIVSFWDVLNLTCFNRCELLGFKGV